MEDAGSLSLNAFMEETCPDFQYILVSLDVYNEFFSRRHDSVEAWYTNVVSVEEVLSSVVQGHLTFFGVDRVKSFDIVDCCVLDRVLNGWGC